MTPLTLLLLWLLLLAVAAHTLRRLPWLAGLMVAGGLGLLAWQLAAAGDLSSWFGRSVEVEGVSALLGYSFQFTGNARGAFFLFLVWGILFAGVGGLAGADRVLYPVLPLILAALLLALSARPLLWAPLWLLVAALLMAFPAQGASPRLARPALRTLTAPTLAMPFFLFAAWVLDQPLLAGEDPALTQAAWRALVIGVGLLLTPAPLHGWITALGDHAPPFAAALLVGLWQAAAYLFIRQVLFLYPALADYADPARWLLWLAVVQMGWAGVFGLGSQRLRQFWGYLLLWEYGAFLLFWGLSGEFGTPSLVWLLLARPLILVLIAAGLHTLGQRFGEQATLDEMAGAAERLPLATISVVAGSLFLLGWPLGALAPIRLTTLRLAEATYSGFFLAAMLSLLLLILALARAVHALTRTPTDPQLQREPAWQGWLLWPLLLAGLLLSLNPILLEPLSLRLTAWLTQL